MLKVVRLTERARTLMAEYAGGEWQYPLSLEPDRHFLHLGEIENMPGHIAVVPWNYDPRYGGQVVWGLHDDDFELVPDEDM